MSKRNIIVLVVCTAILIIVSISTVLEEPSISGAFLSSSKDLSQAEIEALSEYYYFEDLDSDIYLILSVKDLETSDNINIKWKKIEDDTVEVLQENTVYPAQKGSGEIAVSFIRRNESYDPGIYRVDIFLNGKSGISRQFLLSDGE